MIIKKIQREHKLQLVANLQQYIVENTDHKMGNIEVEGILDFVIKEVTPFIYNQAISDARKIIDKQVDSLQEELYVLEVPLSKK